jgi:predicted GH43/DUF377 family glycosyl hydrolase
MEIYKNSDRHFFLLSSKQNHISVFSFHAIKVLKFAQWVLDIGVFFSYYFTEFFKKQFETLRRMQMKPLLLILVLVLTVVIPAYAQPDFTAYTAGNPVIPRGPAGSWNVGGVWSSHLTVVNDTFYMVYNGTPDLFSQPVNIGLATSTDGYTFTKSDSNPILIGDGSGFDAYSVSDAALSFDNGIWYLYYNGLASAPNLPGRIISRAAADSPHGPWTRSNDTLLTGGSAGEWDDKIATPLQILTTDTGWVMYYWGSDEWFPYTFTSQIGMATSIDGGQTWQKYDDPATTSPPYAESDPVLKAGPESFDSFYIFGAGITRDNTIWEMFYSGYTSLMEGSICYASSYDGIHWTKYPGNPIFTFWEDPLAASGAMEMPSVAIFDSSYFLYYDYGNTPASTGIGLATAPVVEIVPPNFTAFTAGNPVIPRGPAGSWDVGLVFTPLLTVVNDTFYLCYTGSQDYSSQPFSIGLATSTDGYTFTKSDSNPILSGDGSGFDAYSVESGKLYYDNVNWYLYYNGLESTPNIPGRIISRATADNPHGPWVRTNDALLIGGSNGEWDDKIAAPLQILPTDTGLVMYYWGSDEWYPFNFTCQIGMATSTDGGQSWLKYDDPLTTSPPYAESDPVLKAGPESFDSIYIFGAGITRGNNIWEIFYSGYSSLTEGSICYASSYDGIHWIKYSGNPIYTFWEDPLAVNGILGMSTVAFHDSRYYLYYDYGYGPDLPGIGVAADPPIVGIEPPVENTISNFKLNQNYPNPFNPSTVISWQLAVGNWVKLSVYDLTGREVVVLVNERQPAGQHQITFEGLGLASGVYLYQLSVGSLTGKAGEFIQTRKALLLK